jgi:hypothetical protein
LFDAASNLGNTVQIPFDTGNSYHDLKSVSDPETLWICIRLILFLKIIKIGFTLDKINFFMSQLDRYGTCYSSERLDPDPHVRKRINTVSSIGRDINGLLYIGMNWISGRIIRHLPACRIGLPDNGY